MVPWDWNLNVRFSQPQSLVPLRFRVQFINMVILLINLVA